MISRPASFPGWAMKLPKITSYGILIAFALCLVWFVLVVTAPLMVPPHTLLDLTGRVGYHDNEAKFVNLAPLPHAIYWVGDAECHQIATRSFFIDGNQMPFCSRDTGLFFGLAVGFGVLLFIRYRIHPLVFLLGLAPMGLDGGIQLVTSYESNNLLRVVTGTLGGIVCAMLLAHFIFALQEDAPKAKAAPVQRGPEDGAA